MKKIISALFAAMCLVAFQAPVQAADVTFSVGVAGNQGGYHARGTETITQTSNDSVAEITQEAGVFEDSHPSVFLELNIGDNMTVGAEWAMDDIDTPTNTNAVADRQGDEDDDFVTNTAQATFSDKTTVYIQARMLGGLYTKIMYHNVNVISNETLGTGGSYGDATIEGLGLGIGYQYDLEDLGVFVRAEVTASGYEDVKAVNTDDVTKVIMIDNMYGAEGSIRVGKTF